MKKTFKGLVSLLLALSMVMSIGAFAFAADEAAGGDVEAAPEKLVYTCIGDSNSAGHNTVGYTQNRVPAPHAYHSYIANALGAELRPFGSGGYRTDEILYLLDPTFEMDWAYSDICQSDVHKPTMDSYKDAYLQAVKDADILSIQVGSNDLFGEDLGYSLMQFYMPIEKMENLKAKFSGDDVFSKAFLKVIELADTVVKAVNMAKDFISRANKTVEQYKAQWDRIINVIYGLNPDVTIIAISPINGMNNTSLLKNSPVKLGWFFDIYINQFCDWIENGSAYHETYLYCDISDLEFRSLYITQPDFWDIYLPAIHPDEAQHAVIGKRAVDLYNAKMAG